MLILLLPLMPAAQAQQTTAPALSQPKRFNSARHRKHQGAALAAALFFLSKEVVLYSREVGDAANLGCVPR